MGRWGLVQQFAFYQRDQVLLQVLDGDLRNLEYVLVADLRVFVEEHQQEHLIAGGQELVPLVEVAPKLCRP